jgi:hypothetical protein
MAIKNEVTNKAIASANPSAIATRGYINALYREAFGRDATKSELEKFEKGTVKDAANTILRNQNGTNYSPFQNKPTTTTQKTQTTTQTKTGIDPYKVAKSLGYTEADFASDKNFFNYWSGKSEAELAEQLKRRDDYDDSLGRKRTASEQAKYKDDMAYIESVAKTPEEKAIMKNAYDSADVDAVYGEEDYKRIAAESEELAKKDVEPYYADLQKRDLEDLKTSYADIRNQASRYTQQEAKSYKETLAETQKSIRARGLTFSGRSRGVLGATGALSNEGVEGELPQQRRYDIEDERAKWQEQARDINFNIKWTLDRMIHYGYPVYRSRAIMKHNGTPNTPNTLRYLASINQYVVSENVSR